VEIPSIPRNIERIQNNGRRGFVTKAGQPSWHLPLEMAVFQIIPSMGHLTKLPQEAGFERRI